MFRIGIRFLGVESIKESNPLHKGENIAPLGRGKVILVYGTHPEGDGKESAPGRERKIPPVPQIPIRRKFGESLTK